VWVCIAPKRKWLDFAFPTPREEITKETEFSVDNLAMEDNNTWGTHDGFLWVTLAQYPNWVRPSSVQCFFILQSGITYPPSLLSMGCQMLAFVRDMMGILAFVVIGLQHSNRYQTALARTMLVLFCQLCIPLANNDIWSCCVVYRCRWCCNGMRGFHIFHTSVLFVDIFSVYLCIIVSE